MAKLREELVRVSKGKEWSDIKPVVINNASDPHTKDVMNLRDFCGYGYHPLIAIHANTNYLAGTNTPSRPRAHHTLAASSTSSYAAPH
jgi:hypothetical protein